MFHILIADNDKTNRRKLQHTLKKAGFDISLASDVNSVLEDIETEYIDMIILGKSLDQIDRYELSVQLKAAHSDILIIMLDDKYSQDHMRQAYQSGADDYITKNIDEEELILKIRAMFRRTHKDYRTRIVIGKVVLDANSLTVTRENERQSLPKKEFLLLFKLLSYPGNIFTRTQLMDEIWGLTTETSQSTLNVHVNRLRKKFGDYPEFELKAVRGIGYKAEIHEVSDPGSEPEVIPEKD